MATASARAELLHGPEAIELGARALPAAAAGPLGLPRPADAPERVWCAFRPAGLAPEERRALAALPSARFGALPLDPSQPEGLFSCARDELARASRELPAAARFFACVEALELPPPPPRLMGVVNVTPDSFSDGGAFGAPERAVEHGLQLLEQGAALLDVGGESTRPGARPVSAEEELRRVLPVVEGLARGGAARVSVDTSKAAVAAAALDAGACLVNDVTAGRADADMLPLVAARGVELVLMHMQGTPADMQRAPRYGDPTAEVAAFLRARVAACLDAGIELERLWLDPGVGFGKRLEHNLDLLRRLPELRSLGLPLCLGVSRKSFVAHALERLWPDAGLRSPAGRRLGGTAAALVPCVLGGAELLRVHDVAGAAEAVAVAAALRDAAPSRSAPPPPPA